ncbi:MAG: family 20 glycosylhydrolase [Bacilli bacterium]
MYRIFPQVKHIQMHECVFYKPINGLKELLFFFDNLDKRYQNTFLNFFSSQTSDSKEADVVFVYSSHFKNEEYEISVFEKQIVVKYASLSGAYYAVLSLEQILKQTNKLTCCTINDFPDLKIRGFMLDISRDKVPTVHTIKAIIKMMSQLKMNHLELYVEGFSFGYPSFTSYLQEDGFISVSEYEALEIFANEHFIDLVPNENGFGHMAKWLATDEFKDLAEKPDGIFLWGRHRQPSTLNPLDPKSFELVKTLYKDMLSIAHSPYFNMNFDEPFELGKGRSQEACEQEGVGHVYIDFVLKAYNEIKKYHKIPLIWGDVLNHHPELLYRLPDDMLFIDWGYDGNYPFSTHLKKLSNLDKRFLAAPGTTSWCSYLGRKDDWLENIGNAVTEVFRLNGEGVILTDWGDFGHLQFLPISFAPIVFMGLLSWRVKEGTQFLLKDYLNHFVFCDKANIMADTIMDLGNYYHYLNEYRSNGTTTFHNFMWATAAVTEANPIDYFIQRTKPTILSSAKHQLLEQFFALQLQALYQTKMDDGQLIISELEQSIQLVLLIQYLNQAYNSALPTDKRLAFIKKILDAKEAFLEKQTQLWLARNKKGGLEDSLGYLHKFFLFTEQTQKYLLRGEAYGA